MLDFFESCSTENYHKTRAVMATLFNAALLTRHDLAGTGVSHLAVRAINAAEALLEELGVVDPDKTI